MKSKKPKNKKKMSFNFKDVDVPVNDNKPYVKPGFWKMAPVKADLVQNEGKTSYLSVTFEGDSGKMVDKFWLSPKALSRLQYLHIGLYNKRIEKEFKNEEEIANYFNTLFAKKAIGLNLVVGGQESTDGRVYANLPFTDFIVPNDSSEFSEGAFEPESARYKAVVKKNTYQSPGAPQTNDTLLSADDDKMPWDD